MPQVLGALLRHRRQKIPAEGHRSRRHRRAHRGGQAAGQGGARGRGGGARGAAGAALRAGPLGGAADLPGDGRRRQGRRDQARDVRRQPAGLPGALVQGAVGRGARPRLPLALPEGACPSAAASASSTAPTTRRCSSSACTRSSSSARSCRRSSSPRTIWDERFEDIRNVERYLARNGVADPQVLPARLEGGAEEALPRAPRRAGEELEVLAGRRRRSASTGTTTWRPTRT